MAGTSSGSCSYYKSRCSLPSAWEPRVSGIRNQNAMQYLKVDGTRVRYVGPGDEDTQAATVRANYPLPADCPLYYFEIKVLDKGQDGFIGMGFCTEEVLLSRLPGWDPHSYGYHGDDGHAFSGSGSGRPYGPTYTTGDVVGALFNKVERSISFYKNGEPLGAAFRDAQEASPLYPCVGLRTRGEEVVANFGNGTSSEPFRTDLSVIWSNFQRHVMSSVLKTELPLLSSRGTALLPQLMYDYLMHQRFWRTAAVLGRDLLRSEGQLDERELSDITVRQQSYDLVAAGRIDDALALLRDKYPPELLSERPSLDFRLRVQKFVEMVAAGHAATSAASAAVAALPPRKAEAASDGGGGKEGPHGGGGDLPPKPTAAAAPCTSSASDAEEAADGSGALRRFSPMDTSAAEEGGGGGVGNGGKSFAEASGRAAIDGVAQIGSEEVPGPEEMEAEKAPAATAAPTIREILAYGTTELWPRCCTPADRDLLTEALSLLAFANPAASPAGDMLRPAYRLALAEELNGAMLACRGKPATSPLERLYQQLSVVVAQLRQMDHPEALLLREPRQLVMEGTTGSEYGSGGPSCGGGVGGGNDALDLMTR